MVHGPSQGPAPLRPEGVRPRREVEVHGSDTVRQVGVVVGVGGVLARSTTVQCEHAVDAVHEVCLQVGSAGGVGREPSRRDGDEDDAAREAGVRTVIRRGVPRCAVLVPALARPPVTPALIAGVGDRRVRTSGPPTPGTRRTFFPRNRVLLTPHPPDPVFPFSPSDSSTCVGLSPFY